MDVILLASTKGGVGKSTLSGALAAYLASIGRSTYLLDLDPQKSTEKWWRRRGGPDNPMLIAGVDTVTAAVRAIMAKKVERDFLIVDSPNAFMGVLSDAVEASSVIALITTPSPKDIEGIAAIEVLIQKLNALGKTIYVINSADRTNLTKEAVELLEKRSLFPPVLVRHSIEYQKADKMGRTGPEVREEALDDIQALWNRLESIANGEKSDGQTALRLVRAQ